MRRTALFVLALASAAPAQAMVGAAPAQAPAKAPIVKVEYYCSPGFEPSYGRCIATAASDEVDLYLNEPGGYDRDDLPPVRRRRHHGLAERY